MTPSSRPQILFAVCVWLAAEIVLQVHGLRFWAEHGGWCGWIWSVALGIVAVWFWLHRSSVVRWTFGIVASLLLLLGPLWQVGSPLVAAIETRQAQQGSVALRLELLRNAETDLSATLATYLANSTARSGWAPELARVRAELAATRSELAALASAPPSARASWLSLAVIAIQLAALIVLQVAAIAALGVIRSSGAQIPHKSHRSYASLDPSRSTSDEFADGVVAEVRRSAEAVAPQTATPKRNAAAATIRERIVAGHYGATPSIRQVMAAEGRRYQVIGPIFKELLSAGMLRQEGKTYRLA